MGHKKGHLTHGMFVKYFYNFLDSSKNNPLMFQKIYGKIHYILVKDFLVSVLLASKDSIPN